MEIHISKRDVVWSYVGQFFNIAAGFITLPLILHMLSTEEIAMNYLMLSVSTLVALMDFGFTPQITRLVSYVFSGAKKLNKEGFTEEKSNDVSYTLLFKLILVTKRIFRIIGLISLFLLLTMGSWYMYRVTDGFTNVNNSLVIWGVFSLSTFFTIYYKYYDSLLIGRGFLKESKQAVLYSKLFNIVLTYVLLLCGVGLLGVCISNLVAPFVGRGLSHHFFYDKEIKKRLSGIVCSSEEANEIFGVIWYNAKKTGVNFLGTYLTRQFGLFISGLYLVAQDVASLGLMMQLTAIISGVSSTLFNSFQPKIISHRIEGDKQRTIQTFSTAIAVYYLIFIAGAIVLILLGPWALSLIRSNATLPAMFIVVLFLVISFLEEHHSNFAVFISTGNIIPFVPAALISGALICIGDLIVLKFTSFGLLGIVLVQGLVQLGYNNWRWPKWVLDEFNFSFACFVSTGFKGLYYVFKNAVIGKSAKKLSFLRK